MPDRPAPSFPVLRVCTFAAAGALFCLWLTTLSACTQPLLAPSDERTPFDRYDAVRNQAASQYVEDKYGQRAPNLRQRLGPKNE